MLQRRQLLFGWRLLAGHEQPIHEAVELVAAGYQFIAIEEEMISLQEPDRCIDFGVLSGELIDFVERLLNELKFIAFLIFDDLINIALCKFLRIYRCLPRLQDEVEALNSLGAGLGFLEVCGGVPAIVLVVAEDESTLTLQTNFHILRLVLAGLHESVHRGALVAVLNLAGLAIREAIPVHNPLVSDGTELENACWFSFLVAMLTQCFH